MPTRTDSVMSLLNQIRNDQQLVLPDLQRDFVWKEDQIRLLMDSLMREYPFGSLLLWQTRFREVAFRDFVIDYSPGLQFIPKTKSIGKPLLMVLDGQQRLQSLYIAVYGSYEGRRLYFNITSGPGSEPSTHDAENGLGATYRFEFWQETDANRPKRLVPVSEVATWPSRLEESRIEETVTKVGLVDQEAHRARCNMRLLRRVLSRGDLVPIEAIDEDAADTSSARSINEILEIFVRVNTGGTRLSRSDLMFSFLKSKWKSARRMFDDLIASVESIAGLGIDKDFLIRGLLTVTDAPVVYDVDNVQRHWGALEPAFEQFGKALRSTIDFVRSPDVRILSRSLVQPLQTLLPVVYYLHHFKDGSVPDAERTKLRAFLYFLLFNNFVRSEARIRWLRQELQGHKGRELPLDRLLGVIARRQTYYEITTTAMLLGINPRLTLNIVQPTAAKETLSWQETAEVDHIFPQAVFRPKFPHLVDNIGNFAYLGKLRNIRKSKEQPADYFADVSDDELREEFLIPERALLDPSRFEEFVEARRGLIQDRVRAFLGR